MTTVGGCWTLADGCGARARQAAATTRRSGASSKWCKQSPATGTLPAVLRHVGATRGTRVDQSRRQYDLVGLKLEEWDCRVSRCVESLGGGEQAGIYDAYEIGYVLDLQPAGVGFFFLFVIYPPRVLPGTAPTPLLAAVCWSAQHNTSQHNSSNDGARRRGGPSNCPCQHTQHTASCSCAGPSNRPGSRRWALGSWTGRLRCSRST